MDGFYDGIKNDKTDDLQYINSMSLKQNPIVKRLIAVPIFFEIYHFLWAWTEANIHRNPSWKIFVIGITGTKGKTTTIELLNAILEVAGKKTALLSSLRVKVGDKSEKNKLGNSMPGRGYIQKFLDDAVRRNAITPLLK